MNGIPRQLIAFGFAVLLATAAVAAEVRGLVEPLPPAEVFVTGIQRRLPSYLEVVEIEIRKHTAVPNPRVKVWHIEAGVSIRAREDLFTPEIRTGSRVTFLQRKSAAGDVQALTAQMVLVVSAEVKAPPSVKFQPDAQQTFGQPRSMFTAGTVLIRGSPEEAAWTASNPSSPATPAPAGRPLPRTAPASSMTKLEERLRALVTANGSIYGEDPGLRPALAFALHDVAFEPGGIVKATFSRITTHVKLPIVGKIIGNQIEFPLEPAFREEWGNPSRPPLFLLSPDEASLTTGNRLPVIPLDPTANRALGEKHQRMVQPWSDPAQAAAHVVAQGDLWNLDTKEKVVDAWIPHLAGVQPVKDAPGLYWKTIDDWGVAAPFGGLTAHGIGTLRPRGRTYAPDFLRAGTGWIAADAVRVVWLEGGDFHRGEFDWKTGETKNRRPVTSLGVFDGAKPVAWFGNSFYVDRPGAGSKPIARIDLRTGEVVEMAKPHAFGGGRGSFPMRASPSGRYLAQDHPDGLIFVYDLVRQEEFRLAAAHIAKLFGQDQRTLDAPRAWANDRVFLGANGWYDVELRKRQLVAELSHGKGYESLSMEELVVLPGGHHIDTVLRAHPIQPLPALADRYRIDLRSGEMVALPDYRPFSVAGSMLPAWVDSERYLFVRHTGSLAETGVWLYDVRTKSEKRLTALLPDSQAVNPGMAYSAEGSHRRAGSPFLLLPDRNQIVFVAKRGDQRDLLLISLADGKVDVLEKNTIAQRLARVEATPIDLNVAGSWGDAWDPARFRGIAPAEQATVAASPRTDEERFLAELNEPNVTARTRYLKIYQIHRAAFQHESQNYWHPVRLAREALREIERDLEAKRTKLSTIRDERDRAVLQHDIQRLERSDYHANDVNPLMLKPEFNRRTYDRDRIYAIALRDAANSWVSARNVKGDKDAFSRFYAQRFTDLLMEHGRMGPQIRGDIILGEWNNRPENR